MVTEVVSDSFEFGILVTGHAALTGQIWRNFFRDSGKNQCKKKLGALCQPSKNKVCLTAEEKQAYIDIFPKFYLGFKLGIFYS